MKVKKRIKQLEHQVTSLLARIEALEAAGGCAGTPRQTDTGNPAADGAQAPQTLPGFEFMVEPITPSPAIESLIHQVMRCPHCIAKGSPCERHGGEPDAPAMVVKSTKPKSVTDGMPARRIKKGDWFTHSNGGRKGVYEATRDAQIHDAAFVRVEAKLVSGEEEQFFPGFFKWDSDRTTVVTRTVDRNTVTVDSAAIHIDVHAPLPQRLEQALPTLHARQIGRL